MVIQIYSGADFLNVVQNVEDNKIQNTKIIKRLYTLAITDWYLLLDKFFTDHICRYICYLKEMHKRTIDRAFIGLVGMRSWNITLKEAEEFTIEMEREYTKKVNC